MTCYLFGYEIQLHWTTWRGLTSLLYLSLEERLVDLSCYDGSRCLNCLSLCPLASDSMWPLPWVCGRIRGVFPWEESNECVSLLIFWGELGAGEILPQLLGQLGEGSMEVKQPQPSLDTTTSLTIHKICWAR